MCPSRLFLFSLCALVALPLQAQRDTIDLNFGWLFSRDEQMSNTERVDLPHDFQIGQPWVEPLSGEAASSKDAANNTASKLSARGFKEMGCGWYRRTLSSDELDQIAGRRVILDFEGIMLVGDVWLNGKHVGKTDYGYLGFECDITKLIDRNITNTILVKADTGAPENSRWYTGGGLYRSVRLIATPSDRYFARHPLYITTRDNRSVEIKAEVYCSDRKATNLHFLTRIKDQSGAIVAQQQSTPPYYRQQRLAEYQLEPITLSNPKLWSPDSPNLYVAEVALLDDEGRELDRVSSTFGVRTVEITPQHGLMLNGKKLLLKGWANHHSLGILGAAAYPRAIEKRLRLMKQFGFNHIRTSHNPYSNDLYRLCDEIGLIVVDELYDKWTTQFSGGRADWMTLWPKDIPEWVKRDRNHPSIVMWSLGNELQQISSLPFNDWGVTAYRLQRQLLQRYDSTRLSTVAMHPRYRDLSTDSLPAPLARATDVQSYNYRYMYFPEDGRRFPWMTFYQSEANMTGLPANFFAMDREKVIGSAYWGAISYIGESRGWPLKGWDDSFFDLSLRPKPIATLLKSMFLPDQPVIQIAIVDHPANSEEWNGIKFANDRTSDHWNRAVGQKLKIYTYTNADEVELRVNNRLIGRQSNRVDDPEKRNIIVWHDVVYEPGTVEALAFSGGKIVARQLIATTGKAKSLRAIPDNTTWRADGLDLQHIRIVAVDSKGNIVPTDTTDVKIEVDGPARLIAVGNGDMAGSDVTTQHNVHLYQGEALAILRSTKEAGGVELRLSAPGFKTIKLKMNTVR